VVTYVNPFVAVAIAIPVLGEQPGVGVLLGALLILSGSRLATRAVSESRTP
jgi:drug/metabolite transporter (DMT)-like permease